MRSEPSRWTSKAAKNTKHRGVGFLRRFYSPGASEAPAYVPSPCTYDSKNTDTPPCHSRYGGPRSKLHTLPSEYQESRLLRFQQYVNALWQGYLGFVPSLVQVGSYGTFVPYWSLQPDAVVRASAELFRKDLFTARMSDVPPSGMVRDWRPKPAVRSTPWQNTTAAYDPYCRPPTDRCDRRVDEKQIIGPSKTGTLVKADIRPTFRNRTMYRNSPYS